MEAIRFGGAIQSILKQVLSANPSLESLYFSKVDLSDAYMRFWVSMEDVLSVAFLIPKKTSNGTHLAGFHLSLPMGYIDSGPYFCMATEMVADLANKTISHR